MLTIFICDDNKISTDLYAAMIEEIAEKHKIEVTVSCFYSGEELLFHLSDSPNKANIIYLDILMRQINGMDTAKRLRKIGCKSEIIFLTSSEDFVYEAFDIEAIHYLLKSTTSKEKFEQVFLRAAAVAKEKASDMFISKSGNTQVVIPMNDISYFEITKRVVTVHYNINEKMKFYSSMKELETRLADKDFMRVHQAYLVNLRYISRFQQSSLILKSGANIPIGITFADQVKKNFASYVSRANNHIT